MNETRPVVTKALGAVERVVNSPWGRVAAREIGVIGAVFFGAAFLLIFGTIAEEVVEGETHAFDSWVLGLFATAGNSADRIGPPWFEEMMRDLTALGSYAFIILTVVAASGYLLLVRKAGLAMLVVASVTGGIVLNNLLKWVFDRPRPEMEHGVRVFSASFPSGHATLSAVTFLTLAALLTRARARRSVKLYIVAVAVVLTMIAGSSRVYLGVHYPSDVLAGWCVGAAWAILCWTVALIFQRRRKISA